MSVSGDGPFEPLIELLAAKVAERLIAATQAGETSEVGKTARSPWMSVPTAAAYLDWPCQRLYKLTAQGAIPHYKQDGRLLFNRQELDRWLAEFRQPGGDWLNSENRAISP
jgi:excisionase family DNA binding protein